MCESAAQNGPGRARGGSWEESPTVTHLSLLCVAVQYLAQHTPRVHHAERLHQLVRLLRRLRVHERTAALPPHLLCRLRTRALSLALGLLLLLQLGQHWVGGRSCRGLVVRVVGDLFDDDGGLLAALRAHPRERGLRLLAILLLLLQLSTAPVLLSLPVVRLAVQHDVEVLDRLRRLREAAVRDAAAQVGLRVPVVNLDRRRAVRERLPVLLELEVAHAPVGIDDRIVLLQAQRVRVVFDGLGVLVGLVRFVALVLLVQRTPLDLHGRHLGQHRGGEVRW